MTDTRGHTQWPLQERLWKQTLLELFGIMSLLSRSVAQSCLEPCSLMDCSTPRYSCPSSPRACTKLTSTESLMPSGNYLQPLLSPPPPAFYSSSIKIFSPMSRRDQIKYYSLASVLNEYQADFPL